MKRLTLVVTLLLGCLLLASGPVLAATEFNRQQTTVTVGSNTITADNLVQYVSYTVADTIPVTLSYSAPCNIVFSGLTLRQPNPFTPPKSVTGSISNVSGTPTSAGITGSVTFDIQFSSLKQAGHSKQFGMAHLNLVLGVDEDCNPATGDANGVDGSVTIPVEVSASTASHP
jgi:hypothetical protein